MTTQDENSPIPNTENTFEDVSALKELIAVIVDYYCFKHNDFPNNDDEDRDDEIETWKNKYAEQDNEIPGDKIIPKEIDNLIESSFKAQLKKFTE